MFRKMPLVIRIGAALGSLLASRKAAMSPAIPKIELATNWGRLLPKSLFMMLKFGLGDSRNA